MELLKLSLGSRSQRNRAAALMRWQKHKEVGHLTCGSGDGRPLQPLDLQQLSEHSITACIAAERRPASVCCSVPKDISNHVAVYCTISVRDS